MLLLTGLLLRRAALLALLRGLLAGNGNLKALLLLLLLRGLAGLAGLPRLSWLAGLAGAGT